MKKIFLSQEKHDIFRLTVLIGVLIFLLITCTFAWFTFIKANDGSITVLKSVDMNYVNTVLYHQIYDTNGNLINEERVTELVISDFVPGQTECYRFEITNSNSLDTTISAAIVNLNADFTASSGEPQPDIELTKVIELTDVFAEGNTGTPIIDERIIKNSDTVMNGETFYNLYSSGTNTNVDLIQNLIISDDSTANVYFKFHMIEDANNYYQYKSIKIESLSVTNS